MNRLHLGTLAMPTLHYSIIESPIGPLLLGITEKGLAVLSFGNDFPNLRSFAGHDWVPAPEALRHWEAQLREYFAGNRKQFTLPLDLRGTEFQLRCWNALLDIPYGETWSYAELANCVNSPRGFRAVGAANGDNPIAIVVPCHRVIASDLTLGGYGGGLPAKELLLRLEGAWPPRHRTDSLFAFS